MNFIQAARAQVGELTHAAWQSAAGAGLLPAEGEIAATVDIPKDTAHGDYASSFALASAKVFGKKPRDIAALLAEHITLDGSYFDRVEIAGPGFLNFTLGNRWYAEVIAAIEAEGAGYGAIDEGAGARVMVEFVSANPTGTMTIGNARGGVLGDAMASILERAGYDVWREFYVNDAGNQVQRFALSLEVRYLQHFGQEAEMPDDGYHGADVTETAELFAAEQGDRFLTVPAEERRAALQSFGLAHNIAKMQRDLARYNITYDRWFLESSLHASGYVDETVGLLIDSGLTYEKDGALWFKITELGGEKDEVLRRGDGSYTYFAVDMAYHRDKFTVRGFDKVIDVLGADHHGHALRFKAGITALGIDNSRLDFLIMQLVQLVQDGKEVKVSKRSGRAITLSDLLDEIPVDAARFFFNAKPTNHLIFDLDLAVRQDAENPVYYVQYAHARICSMLSLLAEEGDVVLPAAEIDVALLDTEVERAILKTLAQLPEEIRMAARDYDPSRLGRYLTALAADFHRFYNANRIRGEAPALRAARLKLTDCVRSVLANCLGLLGVSAPEKM